MRFVPLSEIEDREAQLQFVPLKTEPAQPARRAVNLGEEPPPGGLSGEFAGFADVFAPPQPRQESVLQGRPMREPAIARDKLLDPSFVEAIRQNVEQMDPAQRQATLAEMAKRTDVYGRAAKVLGEHYREVEAARTSPTSTVLARPRAEEEPTFLGQMAKGARGALEYGLPSMGIQLGLQGSASAMVARQSQLALMDRIDQGEFKTLEDLKNDPQYQTLQEEGDIGLVNSYFSNRGKTEISSRLRNRTQQEITKLVGDTAGHIKTLNQYARENKEKYGPSVEKFTDLDWSDPSVVSDFKNWLGYNMGAGAVQMAPIMLAAITTKRPGLLATSASMGVSEAVGARLKFIQDQVKNLPADQRGAAIAKYIADSGDTNLITGLVSGSFDLLLGPAAKAAKAGLPQEIGKLVAVKKAVKELPSDIGGEAVTGALQQATQIAAAKKLQEEGRAVTLENIKDIIDSAAAEAAGAPFGTAINVAMAAATAPSAEQARIPQPPVPPATVPPRTPRARVEPRLEPEALPVPADERREPTLTFEPLAPVSEGVAAIPGMPTGQELEEPAPAPAAPTALPPAPPPTQAAAALPETPTVPPVTKPKAFEPAAEQQALGGLPIQEVPLSQLRLSKDVPQFKVGASEKGVVEPLGGKFERTGVAPIQVWRRLDGSLEIISGRHRFDLAQRSGEKTIPAQIHDEAQGFNADKAAVLDAELNIRDGQGKVKDYVNYFQGSKISREEANARGLLARALGKRAYSIAADGSEELIAAVRADQIGDEAAYYIALNAPGDARLQGVGIKAIMDGKSMNTAINMMQAVKALASEQDTTTDLFGFDDSALREAEEMAKIAANNQRSIQARLSAITGASKNPELARQEGIDIRDPEAVQKRIGELRQMKAAWDNWSTSPELIAQIREERGQAAPTLKPIEPVITAQTEEELRQKAEREAEAERRQREEKAEAERKAKADAERDEFVLTGSDRAADETAARGQADIFGAPTEEAPPAKLDPIKVIDKYFAKLKEQPAKESYETTDDKLVKTQTYELDETISRAEFDALVGEANVTPQKRGNKYAITLVDTENASSTLTFNARGLTPTQQQVEVFMQLQTSEVTEEAKAPEAKPKEEIGAAVMGQRMVNAADRFRKAAMSQFKLTEEQADAAMGKLLKEKILILDPVTGQFELKDGRFWDREVLLKAAVEKQVKIKEPKEIVTARKELKKVKPGEIITPAELARRTKLIEYEKKQKGKEYEAAGAVVVNDKTPSADLPASKRLVIMPCCDMKGDEKAPAMELYKGVFFQTFRGNVQEGGRPNVVILSAKHGFIPPTKEIEPYDQMMTAPRADEMLVDLPLLISNLEIPEGIEDVLIVGGKDYQRVMKAVVAELQKDGTISENASINATSGGIGDQRKQLGEYLRSIPSTEAKPTEEPDTAKEDKDNAEVHAQEIGGEVVWQKGPFALVRGYSIITGDPVYVATHKLYRLRRDIDGWTGDTIGETTVPDDIRAEMIAAKRAAEKDAEDKHKKKPFIKFKDGVAVSDGISSEIEGIIRGWKDILKLDVPIYVGTIEDARINKNNYTGPHRRIGSGTLSENERGSARRMSDGSYYILFKESTSPTLMLETIAHEMGHIHEKLVFENATPEEKQALRDAHQKWLATQKDKTAQELVNALRARATQRKTKVPEGMTAEQLTSYWRSFGEWYADQVSRWAVSGVVPVGVVEKFFKRLGNQLRRFYQILKNAKYLPDETFVQYIEKVTSRPPNLAPDTQDVSSRMVEGLEPIKRLDVLQNIEPKDKGEQSGFAFDVNATDQIAKNNPTVAQNLARANQLPGAKKKLPPGRSPELAAAAQQVQAGLMTAKEYDELVNRYKPIPVYFAPLKPATSQEVYNALDVAKREKINPDIKEGYPVGLRLDIPAFNRHGVYVVSIHEKRTPSAPGKVIGYGSVARIKDVTFGVGNQREALKIATGEAKDAIQTMEGKYVPITPERAYQIADDAILSGEWVQMGIDPTRHAYFFDRRTTLPVVAAQEVIQIGNMILARGVTFGKKEDFLYNIASDQPDLFGYEEPKGDKKVPQVVKRGRVPELTEAAEQLRRGEITKEEYDAKVKKFSPVSLYAEPPKPSTDKQVNDAVDSSKRQYANVEIKTGTRVGTRIDVPAWENKNTWVVSIHAPKPSPTSPKASQILSYRSVAKLKNVVFGIGDQKRSLRIAAGEFKDKLQTMEGEYVDISPEEAYKTAQELINDPGYVQVGFNPFRHAYFYDRSTMQPVVKADEVLQIGNFILAKNPTYGEKADFLYDITAEPSLAAQEGEMEFGNTREQQIRRYAAINRKKATIEAKVAKGEVSIDLQRQLNRLRKESVALQAAIKATAPRRDSAERFMARALQEYDDGNISAEVLAVVQQVYQQYPDILEGLLLSVRKGAEGSNSLGTFAALDRIVTLFKGTAGVDDPVTIRHELAHSLEQIMLPSQALVVVQAWGKALARAIKQHPDELHQRYFNAVLNFIDNPSMRTLKIAQDLLPSYEMYQFINPSEYWAINAESLMAAQLGSAWDKFKKAINKIFQAIKNIFGFNNTYAVHKVFDQVMSGKRERMTYGVLVSMVQGTGDSFVTLNNIQDEKDLIEKYSRPKTPMLDTSPIKTFITRQFKNGKEFFEDAAKNPKEAMVGSGSAVVDGLIYLRNKNVWYGSGLEARDFDKYNGELRTSEGMATASVALDNAIRSGNIGVEVIFRGGIEYDKKTNNFVAVQRKLGMKGVYEAEAAIKARLGDQLGTDIIQGYLEAKRSISIMNELYEREAALEDAKAELEALRGLTKTIQGDKTDHLAKVAEAEALVNDLKGDVDAINKAVSSVNMSEEEMGEFAALDQKHPELREMMDNWTAVNQNLLKFWRQVGLISQGRYETLSAIKDYVPWYRIMNDEEDVHSPIQSTTRTLSNIGREKLFKRGKPISVVDFRAKAGQQDFKIQPSSVVKVLVNGQPVEQSKISVTSSGEVRIDMPLEDNDLVVFQTNREIENIVDNMTRNVMRMTMNGIRQFAANRIVLEYASRNERNKIMVFPSVDKDKGRFNWIVNGKKVVVEIPDPLVAASIYGMENLNLQMWAPLAAVANFTRRTITLSGVFQLKQVFKDAPTAALVTGVKNPLALIGGVYKGFITSLTNTDPVVDVLKAAGIGGYMSPARTPEAEIKRRLGIMNRNVFDFVIKGLDHIGDASDMAQRVATYKRVLAETGDETQALFQAANVINFLHHGSAGYAQAIVKVVPFMGAYANATDVLVRALVGGGLKGVSRKKALMRLGITMAILSSLTLLYCMLAGGDPEYDEVDDQTKLRNIMIPGTKIMLPMNTSAAYFFKAIPELIYNKVTREGTENEMDRKRLRKALAEAARDMLLGPEPIPAGVKPIIEVAINHSFFTGRPVIPEGMKNLEAAEQYTAATSELGKKISAMLEIPGTDGKRVVSPIEADHLIRGIFGTAGAMGQWVSNSIGTIAEERPAPTARETPITGSFLRPEVPRGGEDLFYDFKERVNKKYETYIKMVEREDREGAQAYLNKNRNLVGMKEYIDETESELEEINSEIRRIGTTRSKDMSPEERREKIEKYERLKQRLFAPVKEMRRRTFGTEFFAG